MPDQKHIIDKGGTMRLGAWPCRLTAGSRAAKAYGTDLISERHRHRYEFVNDYREAFEEGGMHGLCYGLAVVNAGLLNGTPGAESFTHADGSVPAGISPPA